jgi:homocysteine S-methyltransferase
VTVVLDGGLATELEARCHDLSDRLWSARLLLRDPAAIAAVHRAYFAAGAQVATTASYQATVPGFVAAGYRPEEALAAIASSVRLAQGARDAHAASAGVDPDTLLVAGSVGPYGAMLADGSEYRGDYDPGEAALRDVHGPRIDTLLEAGADLIAFETIPTVREAEVLVRLLDEAGATGWLSFQCRDGGHTAAGEPIETAMAVGDGVAGLVAIGVNCTRPADLPELLARAATTTDLPRIAYPNGGDRWDAASRHWLTDGEGGGFDPTAVAGWTALGAGWLGGCCGTTPGDIEALAVAMDGEGRSVEGSAG